MEIDALNIKFLHSISDLLYVVNTINHNRSFKWNPAIVISRFQPIKVLVNPILELNDAEIGNEAAVRTAELESFWYFCQNKPSKFPRGFIKSRLDTVRTLSLYLEIKWGVIKKQWGSNWMSLTVDTGTWTHLSIFLRSV